MCKEYLSEEALQEAFVVTYERMRRYEGAWHLELKPLFPHYIFLETRDEKRLAEELKQFPEAFPIFKNRGTILEGRIIPLKPEEEQFLRTICGDKHHIQISRGYIQGGKTFVTEGPLKGRECLIRKIDRHKRMARVRIPKKSEDSKYEGGIIQESEVSDSLGNTEGLRELQIGLEIVRKS